MEAEAVVGFVLVVLVWELVLVVLGGVGAVVEVGEEGDHVCGGGCVEMVLVVGVVNVEHGHFDVDFG